MYQMNSYRCYRAHLYDYRTDQPSSQLHTEVPNVPLLNRKQQLLSTQQTIETELRIEHELTEDPLSESEGQVEEKHAQLHASKYTALETLYYDDN